MNRFIFVVAVGVALSWVAAIAQAEMNPPPLVITEISTDESYGRTQENPIKTGGGPEGERAYLSLLRGPNGEPTRYERRGSCCPFETPNGMLGGGLLDRYSVWIGDSTEPVSLYLNMYDFEQPKAPKGFTFAKPLTRR